ncbi:MAG: hypothetical protein PHE51_06445 [Eubacteriales bacterium]|nr:hypothetical protein [Eubacteriales bacterium]
MKRLTAILLILIISLSVVGCNETKSPVGDPSKVEGVKKGKAPSNEESKIGEEEVTLYIPEDFLYSTIQSTVDDAKSKGATDVVVYKDGSISYKMPRDKYDIMIDNNRRAFEVSIADMVNDYAVLSDIKYNEDFSHFDFYVDRQIYTNSGSTLLQETLYAGSKMIQMYLGKKPDKIKMSYAIYDAATNEKVETGTFPDDLEAIYER